MLKNWKTTLPAIGSLLAIVLAKFSVLTADHAHSVIELLTCAGLLGAKDHNVK